MKINILALLPVFVLTSCGLDQSMTFDETYPPPWQESPNTDITQALARQRIHCLQYQWRKHFRFNETSEALVHCKIDRSKWNAYLVLTSTYKVMGPYPTQ